MPPTLSSGGAGLPPTPPRSASPFFMAATVAGRRVPFFPPPPATVAIYSRRQQTVIIRMVLKNMAPVAKSLAAKLNVRCNKIRKFLPQMVGPFTGNAVLATNPSTRRTFAW